jgi:shikimate kinase
MKSDPGAIFLSGPIGVGKSTLGQSLARALNAQFVEGDEHALEEVRWFACSLRTHRSILAEVVRNAS